MIRTTTQGERELPRYFGAVFDQAQRMEHGRLDMVLPDGRIFRAEGAKAGPVAELHIHNTDIFGRLIREGDLGFCEAYLDEWWSTPDLQAFMDLVHADNDDVYDGFLGMGSSGPTNASGSGFSRIPGRRQGRTSPITTISGTTSIRSGSTRR